MDTIGIRGIAARGYHGVLDWERAYGQTFTVDVDLMLDTSVAARGDDLGQTIDYGAAAEWVHQIVTGTQFQLIESLAEAIAREMLDRTIATHVVVTVHKPQAPIGVPFTDVFVRIERVRQQ